MKSIILCAGYATRLHPLTLKTPKALLKIKGKPLLEYIIDGLNPINEINEIFVVSNNKFYDSFLDWKQSIKFSKQLKIINDNTEDNEFRLGGIGDLNYAINKENISEDILVLLGDNFYNFDLTKIVTFFNNKKSNIIGLYEFKDKKRIHNFGVLKMDKNDKIIHFEEKPKKSTQSNLISSGIYIYSKKDLKRIQEYMKTNNSKEGPGYLIPYFMNFQDVYGFILNGFWYDIGDIKTYNEVNQL